MKFTILTASKGANHIPAVGHCPLRLSAEQGLRPTLDSVPLNPVPGPTLPRTPASVGPMPPSSSEFPLTHRMGPSVPGRPHSAPHKKF